ncbi:hypothetical protein BA894_23545 [Vibrio natriegens]|nr:hypothetical protein BA894_23545 [Vibrio natriegens]
MNVNRGFKSFAESAVVGTALTLLSRVLISYIFLMSGYGKITGFSGTQAYMDSFGVPGSLLPLVIIAELGGGLLILLGFQARLAALGLSIFCLVSAFLFHGADDMNQQIHFMKNLAMAGGLLVLFRAGSGPCSFDKED